MIVDHHTNISISKANFLTTYLFYGDEAPEVSPTLQDIMVFLTDCDCIPPLGFGLAEPSITFSMDAVLPTVSTCSLTLRFPLNFPTKLTFSRRRWILQFLVPKDFNCISDVDV